MYSALVSTVVQTDAGFSVGGNALLLLPIVLIATIPVSIMLLDRYRKAILNSMQRTVGRAREEPSGGARDVLDKTELSRADRGRICVLEDSSPSHLSAPAAAYVREATAAPVRLAVLYSLSGLVFAVIMSLLTLWVNGLEMSGRRLIVTSLLFLWPIIPTILYVVPLRIGAAVGLLTAYAAVLMMSSGLGPAVSIGDVLKSAFGTLVVPTVVGLTLARRQIRTVAPFVFAVVFLFGIGGLLGIWTFASLLLRGSGFLFALACGVVVTAVGAAIAWWLVPLNARLYRGKRISDQLFTISTWWLAFALWGCLLLSVPGNALGLVGILAWIGFVVTLLLGLRAVGAKGLPPARLLLLRVFGHRRRAERLLAALENYWRHIGSIQLIAGTDLATANLEPHEFLEFLTRRLGRRFVSEEDDLLEQVAGMDWRPDPDGRYRVNELFCYDDTWQPAITRLVDETDVVLMDLRGFSSKNLGVIFELSHLVNTMSLRNLLLLVDDTSDLEALTRVLGGAWRQLSDDSPNRHDSEAQLTVFRFSRADYRRVRSILGQLCSRITTPAAQ